VCTFCLGLMVIIAMVMIVMVILSVMAILVSEVLVAGSPKVQCMVVTISSDFT